MEDNSFIFEGESINSSPVSGRFTFKEDPRFWVDLECPVSSIEEYSKMILDLSSNINNPQYVMP